MINLRAIAVEQRVPLDDKDGERTSFLVIELPNGKEVRAVIDNATATALLSLNANGSNGVHAPLSVETHPQKESWPGPASVSTMGLRPPQTQPAQDPDTVRWAELPDAELAPHMKAAFIKLEVGDWLTVPQIRAIEREINDKFGEEEWAELLGPMANVLRPKPAPVPRAAPAVQWADGSPIVGGGVPSRTVPKTAMGYPITQGSVDIGELVAGEDADEDGVGQL